LPELRASGSFPFAPAAIKGLSLRQPYCAICVPGYPIVTDRITVIAAMRTFGPQLARLGPAALYGSLLALSPSKRCAGSFPEHGRSENSEHDDRGADDDSERRIHQSAPHIQISGLACNDGSDALQRQNDTEKTKGNSKCLTSKSSNCSNA
jgi:hypothetical protein